MTEAILVQVFYQVAGIVVHASLFSMHLELGSQCFLRVNLHSEASSAKRGERGTILQLYGSAAEVEFSHGLVVIVDNIDWLEPYPGTFSRGLAALTSKPHGIYGKGMMCSDIQFPTPDQAQGKRFLSNRQLLFNSGTGASFYDGISAFNILGTFLARYSSHAYLKNVGLIVCEHIWPWEAGSRSRFHSSVVKSLLGQMSSVPKILVLRTSDVNAIRSSIQVMSRVVILDGADFMSHYQPLRMDWDSPDLNPIIAPESAIYIKPIERPSEHIVNRPLHIPQEVLLQMFKGKQTLFLASGTCDSPVECHRYLLAQLKLHNIAPPS